MNDKKKNTVKNILLTGSIVAGSVLGLSSINAANVETFKYSELGSGGELRAELLHNSVTDIRAIEMNCGEKSTDSKTKDAKCGEKKAKATESKTKDAKCGEGKCGETKAKAKDAKATDAKATDTKDKEVKETKKKKDGDGDGLYSY
jgi:uncharacterized low-complexity protein